MSSLPIQLIKPPCFQSQSPPTSSPLSERSPPLRGQKTIMKARAGSLPELLLPNRQLELPSGDDSSNLEGVAANVKLILKLLQEHSEPSREDDGRKTLRLAGMLTIIDDVRSRIERCSKRSASGGCNTDLRRNPSSTTAGSLSPRFQRLTPEQQVVSDETQKHRRELSASMAARKSLENMFSSLGREKEMIAGELARKVQELNYMEELVSDLKEQNEMLSEKVRACVTEHRKGGNGGIGSEDVKALQERNRELSEQLLRSLEGYKTAKRRMKEAQQEIAGFRKEAAVVAAAAEESLRRVGDRGGEAAEMEMARLAKLWAGLSEK